MNKIDKYDKLKEKYAAATIEIYELKSAVNRKDLYISELIDESDNRKEINDQLINERWTLLQRLDDQRDKYEFKIKELRKILLANNLIEINVEYDVPNV